MARTDNEVSAKAEEAEVVEQGVATQVGLQLMGVPSSLAVPTSSIASQFSDVFDELDDLPDTGSGLKVLRLAQGMSKEVNVDGTAKSGQYLLEGYPPEMTVTFMPTSIAQHRQFWIPNPEDPAGRDVLSCKSQRRPMRRIEPELHGVGDPGIPCAQCPHAMWRPPIREGGKNRPPECTMIYIFTGVSLTHECRVEFHLKKTSERVANDMMTVLRTRGMGNAVFSLYQESQKNPAGQPFWVVKAKLAEVTPEMVTTGAEIARREMESMGMG